MTNEERIFKDILNNAIKTQLVIQKNPEKKQEILKEYISIVQYILSFYFRELEEYKERGFTQID